MAASNTVSIIPLKGNNYPTWKVQCQMALMRDGVWGFLDGTEQRPSESDADRRNKFNARRDKALAAIVLSLDPALLYLIGDPDSPSEVWQKLSDQFQKKM